jgi:hypothetical protein
MLKPAALFSSSHPQNAAGEEHENQTTLTPTVKGELFTIYEIFF